MADNPAGKDFYLKTAVDVAVDLRSWLAEWVLVDLVKAEDITAASNDLLAFAKDFGAAEAAAEGEKEIEAIASSATKKLRHQRKSPVSHFQGNQQPVRLCVHAGRFARYQGYRRYD